MNPKKLLSALASLALLVACNSGGTITAPEQENTPVVASTQPVATPPVSQPVDGQAPSVSVINVFPNATFEAFNNSGEPKEGEAYITSFDDQVTPLTPPGVVKQLVAPGKSWNYSFNRQCVQLDVEIDGVRGGGFYDKNGQLFKATKENEDKIKECRCTPTWVRAEEPEVIYGEWESGQCSRTRSVTYRYTETQTCTNAKRTVDIEGEPQTEDVQLPISYTFPSLTYPPYTPAVPAVYSYTSYWEMKQGNDTARRNACENRGGTWLNDYNIPNDGTGSERPNVCRFVESNPPGAPGNDMALYNPPGVVQTLVTPAVPASGGNPIAGTVQVNGPGNWVIKLEASNPGQYLKDSDSVSFGCEGGQKSLHVQYNWVGHPSEDWVLKVYRNNVLLQSSTVVHNPSN